MHTLIRCLIFCTVAAPMLRCAATGGLLLEVKEFLERENELMRQRHREENLAIYNYNVNISDDNQQKMVDIVMANSLKEKELSKFIHNTNYADVDDADLKRQLSKISHLGTAALDGDDFQTLQSALSEMQANYAKARVCSYAAPNNCQLTLEPHIQERLSKSRDPQELAWYWKQWYDTAGTTMRPQFEVYVNLSRKSAQLNGYRSYADYWLEHFYEDPDAEQNLDTTFKAILPLYRQLHGYVRHRLHQHYGAEVVPATGNIPMHLLGNMWAQSWVEIKDLLMPYPDKPALNVTEELLKQGYTVRKFFEQGDQFFQSMGMRALPESFWKLSMLTRPSDREVVCHASAWDFFENSDVRIKMCTEVNQHYWYVVHHELGHIQYYLQYENQPCVFRAAPNAGFHEAVGDVIGLSANTPKHFHRMGLSKIGELDEQSRINELFVTALSKVAFMPFAYTLDKYRFGVFRGEIPPSKWNTAFWEMRANHSGVEPPVKRTDNDFDPTAKYHVNADVEYLRYFAAHIFQFQFLKKLCILAGEYDPTNPKSTLDNCDFYGSKEAGKAFSEFLQLGSSKHWKVALQQFTGDNAMNPEAFLEYFKPLYEWLQKENARLNVPLGWELTNKIQTD